MRPDRILRGRDGFLWRFAFCIFRADTSTAWLHDAVFGVFELFAGDVWKKWKNGVLAGEVSQKWEIAFPRCMAIKKNNECRAAWERQKRFLRHLSSENACLPKLYFLVVVIFGEFGGGEKVSQMGMPLRFLYFWTKIRFDKQTQKWKCC